MEIPPLLTVPSLWNSAYGRKGMRDGNQLERMYAVGFKVAPGICLKTRRMKTKKKISWRFERGQMLLHVTQSEYDWPMAPAFLRLITTEGFPPKAG